MKYRPIVQEVEVERFFPNVKPWPEGVEQYSSEKIESVDGATNEWFGWRTLTKDGWTEVHPHDYILYEIDGSRKVFDQKTLFMFYKPV